MKKCPRCTRTYADDTLAYCLDDGSALVPGHDPQETLRIPAAHHTDWSASPPEHHSASKLPIIILATLLVVGLFAGAIGLAIFGYSRMSLSSQTNQSSLANPQEQPADKRPESWSSPSPSPSPLPTPRGAEAMVGTWQTNVYENGQNTQITVTFMADGNTRYLFKNGNGRTATDTATWQYSDETLFERFSSGASGKGSIRWIDDDKFEITIIDNGVPAYNGLKRTYHRIS
jgi:hypothetical protein